jgi:hypothetical protein
MMTTSRSYYPVAAILCTLAIAISCHAAEGGAENDEFEPLRMLKEGSDDGPTIARLLTQTFLSEEEWQAEVNSIRKKFQDWEKDSGGDMGQYWTGRG